MLAVVLAGLLAVMAPSAFADDDNLSLNATIINAPDKGWYGSGDVVEISAILSNDGDSTSIVVDPSCDEVLRVWSQSVLVYDGTEACLDQSRGMDIDAFSTTNFDTLTWDLTNSDGEILPSGDYIVEYFIPGEELSSTVSVHVQSPFDIPDGLELSVIATARDGVFSEAEPAIISVRLHNSLSEDVSLDFGECRLIINSEILDECGPNNLLANQIVTITQIPYLLDSGINEFTVSIGDSVLAQTITLDAVSDSDQGVNSGNLDSISLDLVLEGDNQYGEMEGFSPDISILNNGPDDVALDFTTSCRGEIWVVDSSGNVVMDSRSMKDCSENEVEYLMQPDTMRSFSQPEWNFIDMFGCHVPPGDLLVVAEIPEHDLYSSESITLTRERDTYCEDSSLSIDAEINGENLLSVIPTVMGDDFELSWFTICGLETTLFSAGQQVDMQLSECDYLEQFSVQASEIELHPIVFDMNGLDDGEYTLFFETTTYPQVRSSVSFDWPIVSEETSEEVVTEETEVVVSRVISGTWSLTSNELGTCWLLNSPDEGILTLAGAQGLANWAPERGATGEYLVYESEAAPECSDFAAVSFTVEEVYSQGVITETVEEDSEVVQVTPIASDGEEISPAVVTVGVVVASGGILSLLVAVIATNESWRIPATSAGLWFLGLVGRTSETSDGRYQRGRLMGYLTANPGCHFRALMAALEMSNGQITHHLKILEDEDRIWRRADGRLVRFYPFTSNLHPGILEEDLPMPPLSPDPNSLQGKILRLLDDDGQLNLFPTQSELAHRLERSQQLVSHHLRTLQKYGLVEKKRSGVRNRYCLTREAVFLLETTEL